MTRRRPHVPLAVALAAVAAVAWAVDGGVGPAPAAVAAVPFGLRRDSTGVGARADQDRSRGADDDADADDGSADDDDDADADDGSADDDDDADADDGVVDTGRWDVALTAGLLVGATGVLIGNATVLLAAAVPFAYAAYGHATAPPPLDVEVVRTVSDDHPRPGQAVRVDLRVTNAADVPIPDLRIVDGVPSELPVTAGSPRDAVALSPGGSTTVSYEVPGRRGSHEFGPVALVARGVGGDAERRATRDPGTGTTLTCRGGDEELPPRQQTADYAGEVPTDVGGDGVEFYSVRAYTPGDPMSRIDWNRLAGTGELTTVEFRETRAATVVLVVDARGEARRARRDDEPDAVEFGEYAAAQLARSLLGGTNGVGLALFGEGEYLPPATGRTQALRIERTFAGDPPGTARSLGRRADVDSLRRHLPDESQVVFVSPLLDDDAADVARRLEAYGHAVTVVSPDVTGGSVGGRVERLRRAARLRDLRSGPVRVVDWSPDEPLAAATDRAARGWSS